MNRIMKGTRGSEGFTLIELLIVAGIVGVIAAIALPVLLHARMSSNEASAIGSVRAINTAEQTYAASCGGNGYAQSLTDLAVAPPNSNRGFISPDLYFNGVNKSGYIVTLSADNGFAVVTTAAQTCNIAANDSVSVYFAEAHPAKVGFSGQRSFATDTRGSIYSASDGAVIPKGMGTAPVLQ